MRLHLHAFLISLVLILIVLSGCASTTQLYNEASVHYQKNGNFSDSSLDQNKVADTLFLVSTGYIQVTNKNQLSIYINCITKEPKSIASFSGELLVANKSKVIAYSSGINCTNNQAYPYLKEEGYIYGGGYLHFMGAELKELIQQQNLSLKLSLEHENKRYILVLPIKPKMVWVWPT